MIYHRNNNQVSYGEAIGILLLDSPVPFIPGDVANATTYNFPVRFKRVPGFSVKKALAKDADIYPELLSAARDLAANGVRAVTGDCGFMALHQQRLKQDVNIPVFLSSLFQIPFIRQLICDQGKIGIITASAQSLTPSFFEAIHIKGGSDLVIQGLEHAPEFSSAILDEKGSLDTDLLTKEVVRTAKTIVRQDPLVKAILLECSVLPPYARAVQTATGLPVFDYITLINYVFSALVKTPYDGFM